MVTKMMTAPQPTLRMHEMPFGATVMKNGGVRFRLWAPSAKEVRLVLQEQGNEVETISMTRLPEGFYECITQRAKPGSLYWYQIDSDLRVPDPASRYQPADIHGPSCVIDPSAFSWQDQSWKGYPWEEAVIYELHVGTFTPEGTYKAVKDKLDHLIALGVTAIELMPLSDFPGKRNWGYDGVLPYAPDSSYGHPDDLKDLIQTAHARGLMVFLDVVYNHFGPDGNYLHAYAQQFFTERHQTPWGAAINFDGARRETVRSYFIHNALYWLEEFHFDGLRFDAVHAIVDDSRPDILEELAAAVHTKFGHRRHIHLILENARNQSHYLRRDMKGNPLHCTAQWNDDIHHCLHVLASGDVDGYYMDYAENPAMRLGRCLTQGFDYQGQPSKFDNNKPRGESSQGIPFAGFVSFLQNHDQIGNRPFGDRITDFASAEKVKVAAAIYLLSPQIPMLFMGEEWASKKPFPFFCDFEPELAKAVTEGRRKEFAGFPEFSNPKAQAKIPDPCIEATFKSAILDWENLENPEPASWFKFYQNLLAIRHQDIIPIVCCNKLSIFAEMLCFSEQALQVNWHFNIEQKLTVLANFSDKAVSCSPVDGAMFYETAEGVFKHVQQGKLAANSAVWFKNSKDLT